MHEKRPADSRVGEKGKNEGKEQKTGRLFGRHSLVLVYMDRAVEPVSGRHDRAGDAKLPHLSVEAAEVGNLCDRDRLDADRTRYGNQPAKAEGEPGRLCDRFCMECGGAVWSRPVFHPDGRVFL